MGWARGWEGGWVWARCREGRLEVGQNRVGWVGERSGGRAGREVGGWVFWARGWGGGSGRGVGGGSLGEGWGGESWREVEGDDDLKWDKISEPTQPAKTYLHQLLTHSALPNAGHTSNHTRSAGDGEGGDLFHSGKVSVEFPDGNVNFDKPPPTTELTFHPSSDTGVDLKGKQRARRRCCWGLGEGERGGG